MKILSLKRKLEEKPQENRILKQKNKRQETAFKKVISDSHNKGEVDTEA